MLIGYARVSTQDQNPQLQLDALKGAGCERIFEEKASGAQRDRPQLALALGYAREGDTLVVWKLDRLARSLRQLVETVEGLSERQVGFRSLTEALDADTAGGRLFFHIFGALAEFERSVRGRVDVGLRAVVGEVRAFSQKAATAAARIAQPIVNPFVIAIDRRKTLLAPPSGKQKHGAGTTYGASADSVASGGYRSSVILVFLVMESTFRRREGCLLK